MDMGLPKRTIITINNKGQTRPKPARNTFILVYYLAITNLRWDLFTFVIYIYLLCFSHQVTSFCLALHFHTFVWVQLTRLKSNRIIAPWVGTILRSFAIPLWGSECSNHIHSQNRRLRSCVSYVEFWAQNYFIYGLFLALIGLESTSMT